MVSETCRHRDRKRGSEGRVNENKKKKTWNDFSSGQKAAMIVLGLIQLTLLIAAQRYRTAARLGDQRFKGDVAGAGLRQLGGTALLVCLWSQALSASGAHQRQHLVDDIGRCDRGDVGVVVGGGDLDHVCSHEVDPA